MVTFKGAYDDVDEGWGERDYRRVYSNDMFVDVGGSFFNAWANLRKRKYSQRMAELEDKRKANFERLKSEISVNEWKEKAKITKGNADSGMRTKNGLRVTWEMWENMSDKERDTLISDKQWAVDASRESEVAKYEAERGLKKKYKAEDSLENLKSRVSDYLFKNIKSTSKSGKAEVTESEIKAYMESMYSEDERFEMTKEARDTARKTAIAEIKAAKGNATETGIYTLEEALKLQSKLPEATTEQEVLSLMFPSKKVKDPETGEVKEDQTYLNKVNTRAQEYWNATPEERKKMDKRMESEKFDPQVKDYILNIFPSLQSTSRSHKMTEAPEKSFSEGGLEFMDDEEEVQNRGASGAWGEPEETEGGVASYVPDVIEENAYGIGQAVGSSLWG